MKVVHIMDQSHYGGAWMKMDLDFAITS
jgi:hypothetical protein